MHLYVFFDDNDHPSSFYDVGVEEFAEICRTFLPLGNARVVVVSMGKYDDAVVYEKERAEILKIASAWGEKVVFKIGYTVMNQELMRRYEELLMEEYANVMAMEGDYEVSEDNPDIEE